MGKMRITEDENGEIKYSKIANFDWNKERKKESKKKKKHKFLDETR